MKEWVDTMHYYVPILFSKEDRMIFVLVLLMVAVLPVLLCVLHFKPLCQRNGAHHFCRVYSGQSQFHDPGQGRHLRIRASCFRQLQAGLLP